MTTNEKISTSSTVTLEPYTCVWLDEKFETESFQQELRQVINSLQLFKTSTECENYIQQANRENVVLIVSTIFSQTIIARLHDLPQVLSCYIFSRDNTKTVPWISEYRKIKAVVHRCDELLAQLIQDQAILKKLDDTALITVIQTESQTLESRNATFLWFLLYIEVLLRMHHAENTKNELIEILKKTYANNTEELNNINEFQRTYTADKAILWYIRESCFYRILNRALRNQDFDMLFALRFFITDIADGIKREHAEFIRKRTKIETILVYRGQFISDSELELMMKSVGKFISMNSFLSTSQNRKTALSFIACEKVIDGSKKVLFEITIDTTLPTKAFANIKELSYFKTEDEILITLAALFRIDEISESPKEHVHIIKVSLASEDDYRLKEMFEYMKNKIGNESTLDSLGKILQEMGEYEQALKCYERLTHETQLTLANCHMGVGKVLYSTKRYPDAFTHYKQSAIIREQELGTDHADVGLSYSRMGVTLSRQGERTKALINLLKGEDIQKRTLPSDSIELAETYNSLGFAYHKCGVSERAVDYYQKALDIRLKLLPSDHPEIGFAYNNLGTMLENNKQYLEALTYLNKALEINLKILPPTHADVKRIQNTVYRVKQKLKTADISSTPTSNNADLSLLMSIGMN